MKSHSSAVRPSANMSLSTKAMTLQSSLKISSIMYNMAKEYVRNKNWSNLPTANYVTKLAEGILVAKWKEQNNYNVSRIGPKIFEVVCVPQGYSFTDTEEKMKEDDFSKNPRPLFNQIRIVKLDKGNSVNCSCCCFERTGLPCVHILAVCLKLIPSYKGFNHHNISITWWNSYIFKTFQDRSPLSKLFQKLAENDIIGPVLNENIDFNCSPISTPTEETSAWERVKNYPKDKISLIWEMLLTFADGNGFSTQEQPYNNLSQCTYTPEDFVFHDDNDEMFHTEMFDTDPNDASGIGCNTKSKLANTLYEVFAVHDALKDTAKLSELENYLTTHVNECRGLLSQNRAFVQEGTVGIIQERNNPSNHRIHASYNC